MGLTDIPLNEALKDYYETRSSISNLSDEVRNAYDGLKVQTLTEIEEIQIFADISPIKISVSEKGDLKIYCPKSMKFNEDMFYGLQILFEVDDMYITETRATSRFKSDGHKVININGAML